MARYNKIVWSEGMFLNPHHFQQWDRYHENLLNFRLASVTPLYWGIADLEINKEGLDNSTFMLFSCHGILPGGSCIDLPETEEAPASRAIEEHFDPSLETLDVYLAIPQDRPNSANCRLDGNDGLSESRYFREFIQVVDENTGDNEQEIPIAKKNLKILFTGESLDGYDYLKIAELERTPSGAIALRDEYIPPCITISASQQFIKMIRRLIDLLTAKSDELREQYREGEDGSYEFGADVSNLWLLQTINSFIPELNHFYSTGQGHPEELFLSLARFAGALSAFSPNIRPINLPKYDLMDLSSSFGELSTIIHELLQQQQVIVSQAPTAPTTRYIVIPLKETRESIYYYDVEDDLLDPSYRFYLAVKGEGNQANIELPRRAKVASANEINFLVGKALRGISLDHLSSPPEDIPPKSGYCYFTLDPLSDFWEDVRELKSLAIYIPPPFVEIELELMALEE